MRSLEDQIHEDIALRLDRLEALVLLQSLLINRVEYMGLTREDLRMYHDLTREDLRNYHDWLKQLLDEQQT